MEAARRPRLDAAEARAIADAVRGKPPRSPKQSPAPGVALLFDLTSLQREANSRFGFSRQDHAGLAQSLHGATRP